MSAAVSPRISKFTTKYIETVKPPKRSLTRIVEMAAGSFKKGSFSNRFFGSFRDLPKPIDRKDPLKQLLAEASACPFLTPHQKRYLTLCEDGTYVKEIEVLTRKRLKVGFSRCLPSESF